MNLESDKYRLWISKLGSLAEVGSSAAIYALIEMFLGITQYW
jgi:hypothetical protein